MEFGFSQQAIPLHERLFHTGGLLSIYKHIVNRPAACMKQAPVYWTKTLVYRLQNMYFINLTNFDVQLFFRLSKENLQFLIKSALILFFPACFSFLLLKYCNLQKYGTLQAHNTFYRLSLGYSIRYIIFKTDRKNHLTASLHIHRILNVFVLTKIKKRKKKEAYLKIVFVKILSPFLISYLF